MLFMAHDDNEGGSMADSQPGTMFVVTRVTGQNTVTAESG